MPSPPRKVSWQWNGNELACRPISKIYQIFLQSSPALGPGHVDCQWSENGSRRRRGGSQQAYSKQALKARALFLPLLNGFLALDPQFQRQYCFRQQLRSKGKTLHQSINGYCQMMSQYGCPWSVKENNTPRHMSSFQWFIFLRQLLTLSWGHNLLRFDCEKLVLVVVALRASTKEFPLGNHWDKQGWTDAAVDTTTIRHPTS